MSRKVVDAFKQLREKHRFVRGMVPWLGLHSTALEYDRVERYAGETKYPLKKNDSFCGQRHSVFFQKTVDISDEICLLSDMHSVLALPITNLIYQEEPFSHES